VIVAFDGDRAGRRAAVRAFDLFREADGEVSAALFPEGVDPAGCFREHGAAALAALLDEAVPLADLVIDASLAEFDRWLEFTEGRFAALRAAAPLIAGLPAAQVARQVARVADHLDLGYAEVTEAVTSALSGLIAGVSDGGRRAGRRRGG
jgi:DNA primase